MKVQDQHQIKPETQSCQTSVSGCLFLIKSLRETDKYIQSIFMEGGCYQFHLFIKKLYPNAKPLIHKNKNHIITEIEKEFLDINGIVSDIEDYNELSKIDLAMVEKWSFSRNKMIQLSECAFCEEPIVV